ncbi:uncharacterized protein LOC122351281 [Puntigrus tetrazona]|uniref:uncharacterized protein LOC122351281 n=1 Tax=Puntigrus tetrazona TaxID=1606681 RepID=UPI001C8A986D|nr:uncharacterized protein LOC122351281 [Puntigrus tetrazona]
MPRHTVFSTYVLRNVPTRTAVTVVAMLLFFKYVFTCPCTTPEETLLHCWLYLCLPVGILFFILILMDARLLKMCRCCASSQGRCCKSGCCDAFECCCCSGGYCYHPEACAPEGRYYCGVVLKHILNVFYAASLWIIVAFVDGDWYVCVRTVNVNGTGEQIACKDLPTPREAETLRKYDSESRVIGLILILGLSFLLTISSSLMTRWKPYYKSLYEVYVERETSAILEEKLHEKAVERAKDVSEHSLRNFQNAHIDTPGDAHQVQYQPLGSTEEDVWHKISDPALHLMELS